MWFIDQFIKNFRLQNGLSAIYLFGKQLLRVRVFSTNSFSSGITKENCVYYIYYWASTYICRCTGAPPLLQLPQSTSQI